MLSRTALCINQQALSRVNAVSQRIVLRNMHVTCHIRNVAIKCNSPLKLSKFAPALGTCTKRYSSTTKATNEVISSTTDGVASAGVAEGLTSKLIENIPDAPVAPTIMDTVASVGEPSLASLGLGSWSPSGIVQQALELLHVSCGLPWWEAIMIGTVILRLSLFPLVIKTQKNNAAMGNNMPQLSRIQAEMTQARQEGDQLKAARKARELMNFMKGKDCNPLKNMILPLLQAPIFISVFFGLRKMADLPVQSMKEGGLWWFTDLTCADPYYILPLITAATLYVTIEIGADSTRAQSLGMARYFLRALPVIIFPFTINFPAAILCYWVSSNFISLLQVGILRIPKVRAFFKIPALVKHKKVDIVPQKGFMENVKSSYSNMKTARAMNQRFVADEVQFHRAGRGPIQQTFAYDPTKELQKSAAVMAKKR